MCGQLQTKRVESIYGIPSGRPLSCRQQLDPTRMCHPTAHAAAFSTRTSAMLMSTLLHLLSVSPSDCRCRPPPQA